MNIQGVLSQLGLDKKEAQVYLAILELGESGVTAISKKAGVKRSTTYLALDELEARGLVSRLVNRRKITFTVQHPRKIVSEAELRLENVKSLLPQLESLFQKESGEPEVLIYKGKDQLEQAYEDFFHHEGEIFYIGNLSLAKKAFERSYKRIEKEIKFSKDFCLYEILDDSIESREYAGKYDGEFHKTHFLPKELMPFEVDIGMFDDRVLITSVKGEYFTVSIRNKDIYRAFMVMFKIMWKGLAAK